MYKKLRCPKCGNSFINSFHALSAANLICGNCQARLSRSIGEVSSLIAFLILFVSYIFLIRSQTENIYVLLIILFLFIFFYVFNVRILVENQSRKNEYFKSYIGISTVSLFLAVFTYGFLSIMLLFISIVLFLAHLVYLIRQKGISNPLFNKRIPYYVLVGFIFSIYLMRSFYFGSFISTCTYTEEEVAMPLFLKGATIKLIKEASIITGNEPEMECLDILGRVKSEFSEVKYENYSKYKDPNRQIIHVSPLNNLNFKPVKLLKVQTRGLRYALGGSSPYNVLLLKNNKGEVVHVSLLGLGTNKGDEYLKSINENNEYILNYELFKKLGYGF